MAAATAEGAHAHSYSLWLKPKGALADRLQAEIRSLSGRFPDAHPFAPHVTLLGGVELPEDEILRLAQQLSASLKPYRITFELAAYGTLFHQCVYLLCRRDPAALAAAAAARAACGLDPGEHYMPHLSLLYSDVDAPTRAAVAAEAQARLFAPGGIVAAADGGFDVDRVEVWLTPVEDKSLESWRRVAAFELKG